MVLARVANLFTTAVPETNSLVDDGHREAAFAMEGTLPDIGVPAAIEEEIDHEAARPPYIHVGFPVAICACRIQLTLRA
jgi:hypothetical protein